MLTPVHWDIPRKEMKGDDSATSMEPQMSEPGGYLDVTGGLYHLASSKLRYGIMGNVPSIYIYIDAIPKKTKNAQTKCYDCMLCIIQ